MICELDQRIGFVVLQPDVVPRLVAFDQVRFEQERLRLCVSDGELDAVCLSDHSADAIGPWVGVGSHPRADVDRLADVEHRLAVVELVDPRLAGGRPGLLGERRALHSSTVGARRFLS
jgi:hypothetical protein